MQIVQANQNFGFNYTAYDQSPSLNVAFNVYDVTTGTAVFLQKIIATYAGFGSYTGVFAADPAKTYVVIGVVYTDNTYVTVDTTRSPSADVYQSFGSAVLNLGFVYAAYDFANTLNIKGKVYNTTSGSPVLVGNVTMAYIAFGVYFANFNGSVLNNYQIIGVVYTDGTFTTPNFNYAPSSDSFDCVQSGVGVIGAAYLVSQYGQTVNFGPKIPHNALPPIFLTQGDVATLNLKAVDVNGMAIDLSGASFTTYINGANGQAIQSFPNGQHTANPDQINFKGDFALALSAGDTALLGLSGHKEILTAVLVSSTTIYFRGFNLLAVLPAVPLE